VRHMAFARMAAAPPRKRHCSAPSQALRGADDGAAVPVAYRLVLYVAGASMLSMHTIRDPPDGGHDGDHARPEEPRVLPVGSTRSAAERQDAHQGALARDRGVANLDAALQHNRAGHMGYHGSRSFGYSPGTA
jgi:hypothetical protein